MPSSHGVHLSLQLVERTLLPGGTIRGEVTVQVDDRHRNGIPYEAIRLAFVAIERSSVRDDQGEFNALLDAYTSSRVYLDRHVTLSGIPSPTEDRETAVQYGHEALFNRHRATPYATVRPTKAKDDVFKHVYCSGSPAEEPIGDDTRAETTALPPPLLPGFYTFPFSFRLPPWLPPSFYYSVRGASGNLCYNAVGTMLFLTSPRNSSSSMNDSGAGSAQDSGRRCCGCFLSPAGLCSCSGLAYTCRPSDLMTEVSFVMLSVLPKRQLISEYYGIPVPTDDPAAVSLRPVTIGGSDGPAVHFAMSSLHQTFACSLFDNFCCLQAANAVETEIYVMGSPALVLTDHAAAEKALHVVAPSSTQLPGNDSRDRHHFQPEGHGTAMSPTEDLSAVPHQEPSLLQRPWPVGGLTLNVRVRNHCPSHTVSCVRVELRLMLQIFKSLSTPHTFVNHPLSSYDYRTPIPPGSEAFFVVRLGLPQSFRRERKDSSTLLPPPGVQTANVTTKTCISVCFPGMQTYVEEEESVIGLVNLAEGVDLLDEVLEMPVRYS